VFAVCVRVSCCFDVDVYCLMHVFIVCVLLIVVCGDVCVGCVLLANVAC